MLLLMVVCLTGCVVIPTPPVESGHTRTNAHKGLLRQFTPALATRTEIIEQLGEPDAVSKDESKLAYRSEKIMAVWAVGGMGGQGAAGVIYRNRFYVFEFNPQGVLNRVVKNEEWDLAQDAVEPMLKPPAVRFTSTNTAPAMDVREYPQSIWLPNMNGYHHAGSNRWTFVQGCLMLTASNLIFEAAADFANDQPALMVPYASVMEVRIKKNFLGRRLVIRQTDGKVHSFEITKPGNAWVDRNATQAAHDFLRSKQNRHPLTNENH